MKASNETSAKATESPRRIGRSSASPRLTLTSAEFSLSGVSDLPDPRSHAYRKDLADVALAGRVIASHYAEPLTRAMTRAAILRAIPDDDSAALQDLHAGEPFDLLDNSLGWAWGYAGDGRRVGYVRSEALDL